MRRVFWWVALAILPVLTVVVSGRRPRSSSVAEFPPLTIGKSTGSSEIRAPSQAWIPTRTNDTVFARSSLRTGPDSFLELDSTSSSYHLLLDHSSEAVLERWLSERNNCDVQIELHQGTIFLDLPAMSGTSKFEIKGTNFVAGIRSTGRTVAAIASSGAIFVRAGVIVCVRVGNPPAAATVNSGQTLNPMPFRVSPMSPANSNLWNRFVENRSNW
jgi:hypothetical protein